MKIKRSHLSTTRTKKTCVSPTESRDENVLVLVNANTSSPFCCLTDCTSNKTKPGRNISSPLYPKNYPDGVKCVWVLQAPINHTVKLDLEDFHLELDKKCFYDYMEFFDGDTEEHHLIRERMCGGPRGPQTIESTGQKLMVVFHSDKSDNYQGFRAVFETKKMSKKIV